jgi:hypothetical protein
MIKTFSFCKQYSTMKNILFLLALCASHANLLAQSQIQDTDGNTKVQTEAAPNNDDIDFTINGLSRFVMSTNAANIARIDVFGANESIFIGSNSGQNAQVASYKNTAIGNKAGADLTTGYQNTFLGSLTGQVNTSGFINTGIGANALYSNTTGSFNTALGGASLQSNTTGSNSTAVGYAALLFNTASYNTAVGSAALQQNTTGVANTAVGRNASQLNTTGSFNTAFGTSSLLFNTASDNAAFGQASLVSNTTGASNTAIGKSALSINTTGSNNTAIGIDAGDNSRTNTNCTLLGANADVSVATGLTNATAIGNGAIVNASNKIRLGNLAVTVVEGAAAYTTSDGRFKNDVKTNAPGLDFILGLQPVTYHFDYDKFSGFLGENSVEKAVLTEKTAKREMGFIAQDLETMCRKQGIEMSNLVHVPENETDNYSIAYGMLVVPLVKAVQEQQAMIERLLSEIEALKSSANQPFSLRQGSPATQDLEIRPNPTSGLVEFVLDAVAPNAMIHLVATDGRLVMSQIAVSGSNALDVRACPNGQYFLRVDVPGKPSSIKPLVKH